MGRTKKHKKRLEKEYIAKHHKKNSGTTELIYENELFREIFYNITATMLGDNMVSQKK